MLKKIIFSVSLLFLFALVGCGGKPGVRGTVVFSDDKTPLKAGVVNFVNEKGIARGQIEEDGKYVVGSTGANDGIAPGEYKVYLTDTAIKHFPPGGGMFSFEELIDKKYTKQETTPLTIKVDKSQVFDIELDRAPKK